MKKLTHFLTVLSFVCSTFSMGFSQSADLMAINELINRYAAFEDDGDMMSQASLMTPDRVWIGTVGRITDQEKNMKMQQLRIDANKKVIPDVWWFTDARDRLINFYGDGTVAVASFYWYRTSVLPTDLPPEKAELFKPLPPFVMTQVIIKENDQWKIAHTHSSPLVVPTPN